MSETPNLALPYLAAGQAQKHVTVNESLRKLDAMMQIGVVDRDLATPPASPVEGARYIVAATPTGAWAGKTGQIAAFQDGGWMFYPPRAGWTSYVADEALMVVWNGTAWVSSGGGSVNPVPLVGVNTTADATNKLAVASPAVLFNHAGAGAQVKINKAAAADTGSVLFQTAFSGRAEFGLAGDDDFHVKVSPDGTTWKEAIVVNRSSGAVSLPNTTASDGGAIKQIKSAAKTTGFTTTSATAVATGLAVSITPTASANRVLVRASLTLGARFWYTNPEVIIKRNGTKVWPQGSAPSLRHAALSSSDANSNLISCSAGIEFVDNPASTSALSYEVFLASTSGAHNAHLNLREYDLSLRGESCLVLTEFVP